MVKIKGWKKINKSEWSLPHNNNTQGLSFDFYILAITKLDVGYDIVLHRANANQYFSQKILKHFKTKKQASAFAMDYMKAHPRG